MISFKLRIIREQNRFYTYALKLFDFLHSNGSKVFLFHDILESVSQVKTEYSLSQSSFESFLLNQLSKGYHSNTFVEFSQLILNKIRKTDNSFIVTFDDAYESVYSKAYPFLKANKISFVVFITKELIGKPDYLSEEQVIELSKEELCTIGSHACHHTMFRYLSVDEAEKELIESKIYLENLLDKSVECFAFPYGRFVECSISNIKQLNRSNFIFSFSAIPGTLNQSWLSTNYFLPRINVNEKLVSKTLKTKLFK